MHPKNSVSGSWRAANTARNAAGPSRPDGLHGGNAGVHGLHLLLPHYPAAAGSLATAGKSAEIDQAGGQGGDVERNYWHGGGGEGEESVDSFGGHEVGDFEVGGDGGNGFGSGKIGWRIFVGISNL